MLLLRLMNMKAKKKEIPWNLLLKDFKMESGEEDKELLQEWLQEGMNRDLYQVLKVIWFILLFNRSKINEKGFRRSYVEEDGATYAKREETSIP